MYVLVFYLLILSSTAICPKISAHFRMDNLQTTEKTTDEILIIDG